MVVIETARLNGLDPQASLAVRHGIRTIVAPWRIHDHKVNWLEKLFPWTWKPAAVPDSEIRAA